MPGEMAFFPPSPLRALACFSCNQKRFHCLTIKLLEKASLAVALWLRLRQSQVASSKQQVQKSTECSLESRKNLPERTKRKLQLGLAWAKVNENIAGIPHGNGSPINVAGLHLQQALAQGHRGIGGGDGGMWLPQSKVHFQADKHEARLRQTAQTASSV